MKPHFLILIFFIGKSIFAQSSTDADLMLKSQWCTAVIIDNNSWSKYWENNLLRENGNIGTFSNQSTTFMTAYGISDKINAIISLPYIKTSSTQGTTLPDNGIQDLSLSLKAKILKTSLKSFTMSTYVVAGTSLPMQHYNNDNGPFSLGLGCYEVNARLMLDLVHSSGLYLRPQFSYHHRSTANLERSFYYSNTHYYSQSINVPNMTMAQINLGARLLNNALRTEISYGKMNTLGGTDIRRQEAPLASGNMDASNVNFFAYYHPKFWKGLGFLISSGKVLDGKNVGKSFHYGAGITYQFSL
jgi:hypothetical protein